MLQLHLCHCVFGFTYISGMKRLPTLCHLISAMPLDDFNLWSPLLFPWDSSTWEWGLYLTFHFNLTPPMTDEWNVALANQICVFFFWLIIQFKQCNEKQLWLWWLLVPHFIHTILYSFSFDQPSRSGGGLNLNKNWCLLHNSHKKNIESTYDNCLSMIMLNQKRVMVFFFFDSKKGSWLL